MSDHAGIVDGELRVDRDAIVSGMVSGSVTVATGCRATVSGIVSGDLIVEQDAAVEMSGILSGRIINRGGHVRVTGMVSG